MKRQIKMYRRVYSKREPILRMLCLACLVLITIVAADKIYIDDNIKTIREASSLKNYASPNKSVRVESTTFTTHFSVIKEHKNQSNNEITDTLRLPQVSKSDFHMNDEVNSLNNEINNKNKYRPINKTSFHGSPFDSYKNILALFFNDNAKDNNEINFINTTEKSNSAYANGNGSDKKVINQYLNHKSNQDQTEVAWKSNQVRISKTITNKTEVPWEVQFATDRSDHGVWRAYFYDQAIAVMLQDQHEYIYNCTLIEVIKLYEQRQALERLGKLMALVPVPMPDMVHLITLCGSLDIDVQKVQEQHTENLPMWWMSGNLLRGLLPGTLWCGMGDAAENYHQLGYLRDLDNCCRAHDHCPIKLRPLMNRYGLTNLAVNTKSHCSCDLEFFRCLKAVGSEISKKVGEVYFNYLQVQCLDEPTARHKPMKYAPVTSSYSSLSSPSTDTPGHSATAPRLKCIVKDADGGCRKWIPDPRSFTKKLVIQSQDLVF